MLSIKNLIEDYQKDRGKDINCLTCLNNEECFKGVEKPSKIKHFVNYCEAWHPNYETLISESIKMEKLIRKIEENLNTPAAVKFIGSL